MFISHLLPQLCSVLQNKHILFLVIMCSFVLIYIKDNKVERPRENKGFVTILIWTPSRYARTASQMGEGNEYFVKKTCKSNKCMVTTNKYILGTVTAFDVILFYAQNIPVMRFPRRRLPNQIYVFVAAESSAYFPLHGKRCNNFFNLTWTYKLDSDVYFGYIIIKNNVGDVIGPRKEMHWLKPSKANPLSIEVKDILLKKTKAAAWFVSNCYPHSNRSIIGQQLGQKLVEYNHTLDIFGNCGTKQCPRDKMKECLQLLESNYYFYLAFENSVAEDYVSEKLLYALKHYTVPVVFGGANYSRFLPPGSYLDARNMSMAELANKMVQIIDNSKTYYDFFWWTKHYSYHSPVKSPETNPYCNLCTKLQIAKSMDERSVYKNFTYWWNK